MKKVTSIIKRFRVRILYFAIGVAMGVLLALYAPGVAAHPGGLSKKDGCHNMKADGQVVERHWHHEGTRDVGGTCETMGNVAVRILVRPDPATAARLEVTEQELGYTVTQLEAARTTVEALRKERNAASAKHATAERERHNSLDRIDELERQLRAERGGAMPCIAERERMAARVDETWASGWRDDARNLIRCLGGGG